MPINIKNERVSRLATELAEKTGESITDAVGKAIEHRLLEVERTARRHGLAERLMEIGQKSARNASEDWLDRDFDAELYDEQGMPR